MKDSGKKKKPVHNDPDQERREAQRRSLVCAAAIVALSAVFLFLRSLF